MTGSPWSAGDTRAPTGITDRDEWLHTSAVHDEVVLEVDSPADSRGMTPPAGLVLRVSLTVTPAGRHLQLTVAAGGVRGRHDAEELGPPPTNWDRMRLGGVEWRMVEPLQRWDLSVEDLEAGLRAYLSFVGTAPPAWILDGYEQFGTVSGQVQLADVLTAVTNAPARRTHTWR